MRGKKRGQKFTIEEYPQSDKISTQKEVYAANSSGSSSGKSSDSSKQRQEEDGT